MAGNAGTLGETLGRGTYSRTYTGINASGNTPLFVPGEASGAQTEPVTGLTVHIYFLQVLVSAGGTTSRFNIFDSVSSGILLRGATVTADAAFEALFMTGLRNYPGFALSPGAGPTLNQSGGAAATVDVQITFEIK